ncbi:MAG: AMP-binding protein, partial [Lachnospiraceae bacterium]|nr:AMP-binding protein [Lachnospiraceae bacterium]
IRAAQELGLLVSFGYGLTETSSGVAISTGGDPYAMDVCPDDKITIAEDGEILIEAPTCIMQGYYRDPESTAAVLKDGVLYTGDLGFLDRDGRLHVTGRKKDVLVLNDGTKLFLPEYEGALSKVLPQADLAVALRDGRPVLFIHTEEPKEEILKKLRPVMDTLPRSLQLSGINITDKPLPRTATGKIRRWALTE